MDVVWATDRSARPVQHPLKLSTASMPEPPLEHQPVAASVSRQQHGPVSSALLPDVLLCLLLQACIVGGGQMIHHWIAPELPCCARPQVP